MTLKTFKQIRDPKNPYPSVSVTNPVLYNDIANIEHCNEILDKLSEKPYLTIKLAVAAIRLALNYVGINLPHLDVEKEVEGPHMLAALTMLSTGKRPNLTPGEDCEYLMKIVDSDKNQDVNEKEPEKDDWDNHLYFYMCISQTDDGSNNIFWDTYAQVIDESEIDTILGMDKPSVEKEFPDNFDTSDSSGETRYLKKQRHTSIDVGFSGEKG